MRFVEMRQWIQRQILCISRRRFELYVENIFFARCGFTSSILKAMLSAPAVYSEISRSTENVMIRVDPKEMRFSLSTRDSKERGFLQNAMAHAGVNKFYPGTNLRFFLR